MTEKFFRVLVRQDAYINHEALLSSKQHGVETAKEATLAAYDAWKGRRDDIVMTEHSTDGFDHADVEVDDTEEIDQAEYEAATGQHDDPAPTVDPAERVIELERALKFGIGASINELVSQRLPLEWSSEGGIGVMLAALGRSDTSHSMALAQFLDV
jgi:hypothetical protein